MKVRILFAGTSSFGLSILRALQTSQHILCGILTQPDKPQGRGQKIVGSPVQQFAKEEGLLLFQPYSLKDLTLISQLKGTEPDVMVVVSYGLLLPSELLQLPRYGCLNVHPSLLPRWRGATPIERAIEAGDLDTGVSIVQMTERLDAGPIWLQVKIPTAPEDTAASLHDKLAKMGAEALLAVLSKLGSPSFASSPQDETLATHAPKIQKTDGLLDWRLPAVILERKIRAFNPWPVTYTVLENTSIRIWQAKIFAAIQPTFVMPAKAGIQDLKSQFYSPGTIQEVNKRGIVVATGEGFLQLTHLQFPGKRILPVCDILNAHHHLFKSGMSFRERER